MGAQAIFERTFLVTLLSANMGMKAMKGAKAMSKSGVAAAVAGENDMKPKVVTGILASLATLVTSEVKKTGKFTIPEVCMVKSRQKPATKAGKRMAFGKEVTVKAKPARTIVKAFPAAALKAQFK